MNELGLIKIPFHLNPFDLIIKTGERMNSSVIHVDLCGARIGFIVLGCNVEDDTNVYYHASTHHLYIDVKNKTGASVDVFYLRFSTIIPSRTFSVTSNEKTYELTAMERIKHLRSILEKTDG